MMELEWQHWTIVATIGAPLIVIALTNLGKLVVHLVLVWRGADWWNEVLERTHDRDQAMFEEEMRRLDQAQIAAASHSIRPPTSDLLFFLYQEVTRISARLEQKRVEDHARHEAVSARTQFSDLRIALLWLRHRKNPQMTLDMGTTRPFMEADVPKESQHASDPISDPPQPEKSAPTPTSVNPVESSPQVAVVVAPVSTEQITQQLLQLASLVQSGFLTREEFEQLKSKLLSG